jgi:hypothetical protein
MMCPCQGGMSIISIIKDYVINLETGSGRETGRIVPDPESQSENIKYSYFCTTVDLSFVINAFP